jgi:hypothetical protein
MSNGIGKEYPYQRIVDLETAINLALDEESDDRARREFNRRVMARRVETECYEEDGLYEWIFHRPSGTLTFRFVDGSSATSNPSIGTWTNSLMNLFATPPMMADKWIDTVGHERIQEMTQAMKKDFLNPKIVKQKN